MGVLTLEDKIEKFLTLGNGYGYGNGYGNGDGNGYGNGDGYGNGNGMDEFEGHKLYKVDGIPTAITAVHTNYATGFTIKNNCIKVECYIARCGKYFAHGDTLRQAMEDAKAKYFNNMPTEDRIKAFLDFCDGKEYIPAKDLFRWHNTLTGSCDFGRRQFCSANNIDINNDHFTVKEFIKLTRNSFGGDVIRQLEKEINHGSDTTHRE